MKVKVTEEPAWKRVLEIEVDSEVVQRELDHVVEEYRKGLALPGFRKGKVPAEMAKKHLGGDLESEVLRRVLPQAFEDAVRDSEIRPIGDPRISNLQFRPGEPLTFTATVEVLPQVEITGYKGLKLSRVQPEVKDEDIDRVLDHLRDQNADLEEVDRPAHGGDVVVVRYRELDALGNPMGEDEPMEISLTLGSEQTPEPFNQELMGTVVGDMKKIALPYPEDYPDEELAGKVRTFHTTVAKVQEKIWPAVDDAFAKKVLGTEEATAEDLRARVRLNMEVEARMRSMKELEGNLMARLLELNSFELPQGIVESTLDRILEQARQENPGLPPDEESRLREAYRPQVETRYRTDILVNTVARQENIEISDEDLGREIESFAEQEKKKPAQIRAELKREGNLERLREDLLKRRVVDTLVEAADITVAQAPEEETD